MSGFNYSKWDNIELSDDESDLHPNIDKDSWFRMKHRTRLEREAREDEEVKEIRNLNKDDEARLAIVQKRIARLENNDNDENDDEDDDIDALQGEASELIKLLKLRKEKVKDIEERRKWNAENICTVKDEVTIVNEKVAVSLKAEDYQSEETIKIDKPAVTTTKTTNTTPSTTTTTTSTKPSATTATTTATSTAISKPPTSVGPSVEEDTTPRENLAIMSYNNFATQYEEILEKYSEIDSMDKTKSMLFNNCDVLLHEHAQSYLLLSCLEDEMNGKTKRMKGVCRQSQILSHINELGVSMNRDPRDVILPFFSRMEAKDHFKAFGEQVQEFIKRIQKRAVDKRKEIDAERVEMDAAEAPLGPGGLNPIVVLRNLPKELKDAFESQDIENLQTVLANMDPAVAKKCMKDCVDSGLWVPSEGSSEIFKEEDSKDK